MQNSTTWPADFRAGFVAIVGRPNAGKSTLTNALIGQKITITANQPETTRRAIRGILNRKSAQLILLDTPGLHRPRTLLGKRLNEMVRESLSDADVAAFCLPADEKIGPGDKFLLDLLQRAKIPLVAVITKSDTLGRAELAAKLLEVDKFGDFTEIVPVSALENEQLDVVAEVLQGHLPLSPPLYPRSAVTDESTEDRIAELIRAAALEGAREELPHSIAVVIEDMEERPGTGSEKNPPLLDIRASLYVERDSQKGIVIGRGGARLKAVGKKARLEIEELLGRRIYLDIRVKVAKEWQRDPKLLQRFGF
ncbi:GTPase Era [Arcanobacterium urinimassiliense]|uniref:GTPase Era n=1 Tax=Arcanobacterium urinimassiliense TaxID=1871014 RepID=UPI00093FD91C|nr:GTPase Era [Arcanobacterium urinimassiliense]